MIRKITPRYTKYQYLQGIYRQVITPNNCGMDKYERRRLNLIRLRDERCGAKAATVAKIIGCSASYASRMLSEPDKAGHKKIADDMVDAIESGFELPRGWLDDLVEAEERLPTNVAPPRPALTDRQEFILAAAEGLNAKQAVALSQAAGWLKEGREIKPGDPPQKLTPAGEKSA